MIKRQVRQAEAPQKGCRCDIRRINNSSSSKNPQTHFHITIHLDPVWWLNLISSLSYSTSSLFLSVTLIILNFFLCYLSLLTSSGYFSSSSFSTFCGILAFYISFLAVFLLSSTFIHFVSAVRYVDDSVQYILSELDTNNLFNLYNDLIQRNCCTFAL